MEPFTCTRLMICEGIQDAEFFRRLITHIGLAEFDIMAIPDFDVDPGKSNYWRALNAAIPDRGFSAIRQILLVGDSDNDPDAAFADIKAQVDRVAELQSPAAPLEPGPGVPSISIMVLPSSTEIGSLDTLWLEAAMRGQSGTINSCLEQFATCAGVDKWDLKAKRDKMKLRSLLSAVHYKNPDISVRLVWSRAPELIPIADPAFREIAEFLTAYVKQA